MVILLKKLTVNKNVQNDINFCYVWVCNLVSHVKERTQAEEFEHRVLRKIFGPWLGASNRSMEKTA